MSLMEWVMSLARQAKARLKKDLPLLSREQTLSELMAERGLNEFGRTGAASPALAKPKQPSLAERKVKFVCEFSYDIPGMLRASVVELNNREFRGYCDGSDEMQSFSWGKVRGLMKIVDNGEMLSPYEAFDRYH